MTTNDKELNKGLKAIAESSVFVLMALFLSKLFFYIYRLIIARSLGPEVYGLFSLAIIILFLSISLFSLGFDQGLLRFVSLYRGKNQEKKIKFLYNYSRKVLLFSGILAAVFLYSTSEIISIHIFHNTNLTIFLKVFSILIPIYIFANVFLAIIRAHEKIVWYSFIENIFQNLAKVVFLIVLLFIGLNQNAVPISYFVGILGMLILSFYVVKKYFPHLSEKSNLASEEKTKLKKEFFVYSWPIMFLGIVNMIFYWIDSFSIGFFKSAVEVGLYNAAVPVATLMAFSSEIFLQMFFPLITKELSKKRKYVVKEISKQVSKWIFIINLPFFILVLFFPEAIINILFGDVYLPAANALRILSVGVFISALTVALPKNLILTLGKSKVVLINLIILAAVNFILNWILVPKYGINGAAISTTIVNILLGCVFLFELNRFTKIFPARRKMLRVIFVAVVPTILLFIIRAFIPRSTLSAILLGILFLAVYTFLLLITKCLDRNDFMVIKGLRKKYLSN